MAALTADNTAITKFKQAYDNGIGYQVDYQVAASTVIYKGGFVALNDAGYLVMYVAPPASTATATGNKFVGIALEHIASQTSAGDARCRVQIGGYFTYALTSAVIADVGKPVFASDDNTLTKVGLGNAFVGTIVELASAGNVVVELPAMGVQPRGGIIQRTSATLDLTAASDVTSIIFKNENHNGLIITHAAMYLTVATDATSCVVTLRDTAGTTTGITLTSTVTSGDAIGDIVQSVANKTAFQAATGSGVVFVPADLGLEAFVTTASGTGAGVILVEAWPIA